MNETEVYIVPNFLMTNSYQDIEFGRFVYFFNRAGQFCTQKYWKRIGRKNTMIGINVPKVKNKIKVNMYIKVSLLGVDSLWGDCTFIPADWGS